MKDLQLKSDQVHQASEGECPHVRFFEKCQQENIVAQPTFAKVDAHNQRLTLTDFLISEAMSKALE